MARNKSLYFYLLFLVIAVAGISYGNSLNDSVENLRVWDYENILWLCLGLPMIYLQKPARLPELYNDNASRSDLFYRPVIIGILFGLLDLLLIEGVLQKVPHRELPPYTQPFPYSLFLYLSGAFEIEVFYRLIPVTLIMLLFSRIRDGKYLAAAFMVIAVLSSLREPLEQFPSGPAWFQVYAFASGFAMNFIQVWLFRKTGFTASLMVRLGHYLVWHILNGIYIQYVVLNR